MIDTLATITERIIRRLSGGDIPSDSPYKKEFIALDVRDALRADLKLEMLERRSGQMDDRTPITQFIATYANIDVMIDEITKRAFIDLPSNYSSMKHNAGVHWVASMKTPEKRMIPVSNPSVTMHLPQANLEKLNYNYYVEGLRVFFMRDIKKDKENKVLLKLIVAAPDTWGMDTPLPILPDNLSRIMDAVVQKNINPKVPQDRLNDGNPNYRPANG